MTRLAAILLAACLPALGGCFSTLQSARIHEGFHWMGGAAVLSDQTRNDENQGADVLLFTGPAFGFGAVEVGIPVALYHENGLHGNEPRPGDYGRTLLPFTYLKVGLWQGRRDAVAIAGQTVYLFIPASATVIYSRDYGRWSPYVSAKYVFSGGPAGDDPVIERYQEDDQYILAGTVGVEYTGAPNTAFEVGVMRNSYAEGRVFGDFGQPATRRTLYDLFAGFRLGW